MSILSGFFKTIKYRMTDEGYKWQSERTSSQTVVMGDGTDDTDTLEKRLGAIKGLTTSTSVTTPGYVADATVTTEQGKAIATLNESLSKKQDASTAITTSNISMQNVNSVGGSTIGDIHEDAQKRANTKQEKLIMELYTASTNTNYAIVNKTGYTLLSAYSVRDDSSYFVKGINKRNDGRYTLIIDGLTSSAAMSFWLTWAKESQLAI